MWVLALPSSLKNVQSEKLVVGLKGKLMLNSAGAPLKQFSICTPLFTASTHTPSTHCLPHLASPHFTSLHLSPESQRASETVTWNLLVKSDKQNTDSVLAVSRTLCFNHSIDESGRLSVQMQAIWWVYIRTLNHIWETHSHSDTWWSVVDYFYVSLIFHISSCDSLRLCFVLSASDVVSLDDSSSSSSSLVYRLSPGGPRRTSRDVISLKFKTLRNSGTLLHAEGEGGLGLSLELERGKLQLLLRQGTTHQMMHKVTDTDTQNTHKTLKNEKRRNICNA